LHVKRFLFNIIKQDFGYGYIPEYHWDVVNLEDTYIKPYKNTFFVAFDKSTGELIGTGGLRSYDNKFTFLRHCNPADTASLCRVFVSKKWRRMGVASEILHYLESFAMENGYSNMYLHTHRTVSGALDFWLSRNYRVTMDTHNEMGTVHLQKEIIPAPQDELMVPPKLSSESGKSPLKYASVNPVSGAWEDGR
jgi:GNAT superfamily N-acetyltransferase